MEHANGYHPVGVILCILTQNNTSHFKLQSSTHTWKKLSLTSVAGLDLATQYDQAMQIADAVYRATDDAAQTHYSVAAAAEDSQAETADTWKSLRRKCVSSLFTFLLCSKKA